MPDTSRPPVIEAEPARPVERRRAERRPADRASRRRQSRADRARRRLPLAVRRSIYVAPRARRRASASGRFVVVAHAARPGARAEVVGVARRAGSETAQVRQIADQIAKQLSHEKGGQQLVAALAERAKVTGSGRRRRRERDRDPPGHLDGQEGGERDRRRPGDAQLSSTSSAGSGANCSIKGGTASTARHALLRREALELALYTFKYVHDIDSVSVFLPPRPDGASSATSVFLKRSDVKQRAQQAARRLDRGEDADDRRDAEEGARAREQDHRAAALLVRVPAGAGRERRADLQPGRPRRLSSTAAPSAASRRRSGSTASTGGRARSGSTTSGSSSTPWFFRLP